MDKNKIYPNIQFKQQTIIKAFDCLHEDYKAHDLIPVDNKYFIGIDRLKVTKGKISYTYDNEEEFFADYRDKPDYAYYRKYIGHSDITVDLFKDYSKIQVSCSTRAQIDLVFNVFENDLSNTIPLERNDDPLPFNVFIGHGRNPQWRELKDHLVDKHKYDIIAYEIGSRAGHSIRDILDEMLSKSSLALLVMTAEDIDANGNFHARENVIHEIGLFQGRLGFSKAIILLEEGATEFSNIKGIEQIRFKKDNIKETFGDVIAVINREKKRIRITIAST